MKTLHSLGIGTSLAAAIALALGAASAQAQETRSQTPEQRSKAQEHWLQKREPTDQQQQKQPRQERQSQADGVDDEEPMLDNPDVQTGYVEDGMVPDGQHADHLHWSTGTMPQNRLHSNGLMGSNVLNLDNVVVGQVVDLVLDEEDRIVSLVVSTGEKMGLGGRKVAIPWDAVQPVRSGEAEFHLVVDSDLESLADAEEYGRD